MLAFDCRLTEEQLNMFFVLVDSYLRTHGVENLERSVDCYNVLCAAKENAVIIEEEKKENQNEV